MDAVPLKVGPSFLQRHISISPRVGLFSSFNKTEPSSPARPPAGEAVRRADMTALPAGAGWHAVAVRGSDHTGIWPAFAIDFLAACNEFKPLQEHLREYARDNGLGSDQVREITHWAGQMIEAGLLLPQERLIRRCAEAAGAGSAVDQPVRIEAIAIPTAGHQGRLRRVIDSFAANARAHGRRLGITVSSNGPAPGAESTAALVSALAREHGIGITLLDESDRLRQAAELTRRAGIDPAIAAFALSDPFQAGFACGANRNAMLLSNAGHPYLSLDDDMVCEMSVPSGLDASDGLLVFSSRDGFERWFHPEYARAFESRKMLAGDYLALHERMLGRRVAGFFPGAADVNFVGVSDDLLRRLQETDGRIVATFTGHLGHPGIPTSYYYLTYRRDTLARLTGQGEAQYRAFLASGAVCALVPRMAIADSSLSPGMAIGIDARDLVPPFPPVMHAEDFVWGAALWQCRAAGFAGHLPVAARHDPGPGRGIIAPPFEGARPVALWEFAHLLRGVLIGWMAPPGALDTAARMDSLGRYLCDVAGSSATEFHEYLRWFAIQHESDKIGYLEACLTEERDAPDFWRGDVEDYIEQTRHALAEPDFDIPFDMRDKWTGSEARALIQKLILEYGRLLRAWPALFEAARSADPP